MTDFRPYGTHFQKKKGRIIENKLTAISVVNIYLILIQKTPKKMSMLTKKMMKHYSISIAFSS